jgi:hypothetical protein
MGRLNVKISGTQTGLMEPEQVRRLAGQLDGIDFVHVDDRIFAKCPDSPVATISISVDRRAHRVTCSSCPELETATQSAVWGIAQEIDDIVLSERWVR